jgi:hypothetical protein
VTGWGRLKFFASSTAPDADFVVEIADVAPDGVSKTIARGWLNAPQYFSRSRPEPLVPGRIYEFDMEMWPSSYVYQKGHRIRVALSGSDSPGTGANPTASEVTVYQDAQHPSALRLPVIGTSWRSLEPALARCVDHLSPVSRFNRRIRATRRGVTLSGTSLDRLCGTSDSPGTTSKVEVAVARLSGKGRCRFFRSGAKFSRARSCAKPIYLTARGTVRWRLTLRGRLPRGRYVARARAVDLAGNLEPASKARNQVTFRVR